MSEHRRLLTSAAEVAACVRERRAELRLTQAEVAKRAGVTRQFVSAVEHGHETAELGKVLAVLIALQVTALAIPEPTPDSNTTPGSNIDTDRPDLKAHLADYKARGWE